MTSQHQDPFDQWLIDEARSCQPPFSEDLHQRLMHQVRRHAARAPSRDLQPRRWGRIAAPCALVAALLLLAVRIGSMTPPSRSETAQRPPVAGPETTHGAREAETPDDRGEMVAATDAFSFCDGLGLRIAVLRTGPSEVLMTLSPQPTPTSAQLRRRSREPDGVRWRGDQRMLVLGF